MSLPLLLYTAYDWREPAYPELMYGSWIVD
jgi:hypothetical protein